MVTIHDLFSHKTSERITLKQKNWFRGEYCSDEEQHIYSVHHQAAQMNKIASLGGYF